MSDWVRLKANDAKRCGVFIFVRVEFEFNYMDVSEPYEGREKNSSTHTAVDGI